MNSLGSPYGRQRSGVNPKKVALLLLVGVAFVYGLIRWFLADEGFTPEEINSILQNKEKDIVKINKVELTAQGLSKPFLEDGSYQVKNWDVAGNAIVKNNQYIRLTSDNQHQVGNMFAKKAIQAQSFEMELTFHIHSKSTTLMADGFAIWLLDQKSDIGDVFGAKNNFNGLGIMIDTYKNGKRGQFPYVNIMLGDGKTSYLKGTDGYDTRLAGCNAQMLVNPANGETKARIVYMKNGYFSLDFNHNGKHESWVNCVTLHDVHLPIIKYLGLSAETGELSENVDILENKMYGLYKPDGQFIESIEELQELVQEQNEDREIVKEELKSSPGKNGKPRKPKRQTRKSIRRLQKAEQRIKERTKQRRLEKYGDENMNGFKYAFYKFLSILKHLIYIIIGVILLWFGFIFYRVIKQNKKSKVTGLLD